MIVEEFAEEGKPVPTSEQMTVSDDALVAVNV
jgi:hypothetical protein